MIRSGTRKLMLLAMLSSGSMLMPLTGSAQSQEEVAEAAGYYVEIYAAEWLKDPIVADAINAQNSQHADLVQADIDRLDKQWRVEAKSGTGEMIKGVLGRDLSSYLKRVQQDSNGLISEIFVMDNKGLNVGQSDVTSDYWQGDEDKWQKTYLLGAGSVFVDEVELDESSQRFQTQVSVAISDPVTGKVIGAVTIGIDAEGLMMM